MRYVVYADDLVIFASTDSFMREALGVLGKGLASAGLSLNPLKSHVARTIASKQGKQFACDPSPLLLEDGSTLAAVGPTTSFRLLGVQCNWRGVTTGANLPGCLRALENVTSAPLKPQQRLLILRQFLFRVTSTRGCVGRSTGTHSGRLIGLCGVPCVAGFTFQTTSARGS